ncbi:MAG: efflux RND transporter periplasmic adaptor subunit [Bryobacteraceae bacterium]|nr:efflux RND transporter periplasmic adaptor subunit [Bryobacteraceae bacterium]
MAVQTSRVAPESLPATVNANGELFAEELANISTKVPGRVTRLAVDLGSLVKAGDVLAELEKDDYQYRVRQAEAQVEQIRARLALANLKTDTVDPERTAMVKEARAALEESRIVYETTERLATEGVVSRIEFERARARKQGLEARVQSALSEVLQMGSQLSERRAQLDLARQQLTDTVIRAPFDGAITKRVASVGEFLATNAPVVTLVRQHPLRVRLEVPERFAGQIHQGQAIDIRLEGSTLKRTGRVMRLSPSIEAQNRSLTVEGEIPNQDGRLRPGSFVEGSITVDSAAQGITVPIGALVSFAGVDRVFVVTNGQLDDRVVRTGRRMEGERVEVLQGLKDGDAVVAKASEKMAKGQKVRVTP